MQENGEVENHTFQSFRSWASRYVCLHRLFCRQAQKLRISGGGNLNGAFRIAGLQRVNLMPAERRAFFAVSRVGILFWDLIYICGVLLLRIFFV